MGQSRSMSHEQCRSMLIIPDCVHNSILEVHLPSQLPAYLTPQQGAAIKRAVHQRIISRFATAHSWGWNQNNTQIYLIINRPTRPEEQRRCPGWGNAGLLFVFFATFGYHLCTDTIVTTCYYR